MYIKLNSKKEPMQTESTEAKNNTTNCPVTITTASNLGVGSGYGNGQLLLRSKHH